MYVDNRIFNEIIYIHADENYDLSDEFNNYEVIESLIRNANPIKIDESNEDYSDRILLEMESSPLLGIIPINSLLQASLATYQQHFDLELPLGVLSDEALIAGQYFLTRDSNYNVVEMDLLNGDDNNSKINTFIEFINSPAD